MKKNFTLPKSYEQLESSGYFDISNYTRRDDFDSKYVWFYDMEWLSLENIHNYKYIEGQNRDFIPFAMTGGGDLWGWYNSEQSEHTPVVFCPSDDNEGIYYAPSFSAALFRHIFEFASQNNFCIDKCRSWEFQLPVAKQHIYRWEKLFAHSMPKTWTSEIQQLQSRELVMYTVDQLPYYVMLTPEEANDIVKRHLNYDLYDSPFICFND